MATSKIKKVTIPRSSLPPVGPDNNYLIRYRIVSEDKNRSSHWSQLYNLSAPAVDPEGVGGSVSINDNIVIVTWNPVKSAGEKESYDLFINVDNTGWQLKESPSTHSAMFVKPTFNNTLDVAVQIESYLKVYNESLVVYDETFVV